MEPISNDFLGLKVGLVPSTKSQVFIQLCEKNESLMSALQLMNHPYLSSIGMTFNSYLKMVICMDCTAAIGCNQISDHLSNCHEGSKIRIDHTELNRTLRDLGAQESFDPKTLPAPCSSIEGVSAVISVLACPYCSHMRATEPSMTTHHRKHHKEQPLLVKWESVFAQQLHPGNNSPYFQVFQHQVSSATKFASFLSKIEEDRKRAVDSFDMSRVDARQVSPWLHTTGWHLHVAPYSQDHLWSLVQLPSTQDVGLDVLKEAVNAYTKKSNQKMDTLSTLARQVINSPDPK